MRTDRSGGATKQNAKAKAQFAVRSNAAEAKKKKTRPHDGFEKARSSRSQHFPLTVRALAPRAWMPFPEFGRRF